MTADELAAEVEEAFDDRERLLEIVERAGALGEDEAAGVRVRAGLYLRDLERPEEDEDGGAGGDPGWFEDDDDGDVPVG